MASFSKSSQEKLSTCHEDLQKVFNEVIKHFDCTVTCGNRSRDEQHELYMIGRELVNGKWEETGKGVVTNCDGNSNISEHNYQPSRAVDVVPYPIDYSDTNRMRYFIGFVLGVAFMLKQKGEIENTIVSGIDWDNDTDLKDTRFFDFPHFQLKQ
jgi:peptidoglycan L-alanyl-D-glutamate endopeptidase CwlK